MSNHNPVACSSCGSTSFAEGQMGNGHANLRPVDKVFSTGSPVVFIFCKVCGEVFSIRVENTSKFD